MREKYYIADICFDIDSEIPLDFYEADRKFHNPASDPRGVYNVRISLVDSIEIPDREYCELENCRSWIRKCNDYERNLSKAELFINNEELRIYPYLHFSNSAISAHISGNQITIGVLRKIWNRHMHSFSIWSYLFLERILLKHRALILHSASIIHKGKAILFTAPSETGKTTQTDIWHRNDASVSDLNGDRTILQKTENGWRACGIPISGTSDRCEQAAAPIECIAYVSRAVTDSVSLLSVRKKLQLLYGQLTIFSADEDSVDQALFLLEDLVASVKIVQLNCTMNDSAYYALLNELSE